MPYCLFNLSMINIVTAHDYLKTFCEESARECLIEILTGDFNKDEK